MPKPELYIGLMSGTSMDGIDAALVNFSATQPQLINSHNQSWPKSLQQSLIKARGIPDNKLNTLSELDNKTAEVFAQASNQLLKNSPYTASDISAIGHHGQTIRHRPDIKNPFSLQIGNAKILAKLTGIDVVSNFRTADIQAGGQGAPLAPAFHQAVFQNTQTNRVIVNIGGISNITRLNKDPHQKVIGFDCGPGNTLMDAWVLLQKNKKFDIDGKFAARGKTNARLLAQLLMDEYFQLAPPKSTGFEYFNLNWLNGIKFKMDISNATSEFSDADIQSTLCDLTANSIIRAINQYASDTNEIYICGGGVHNKELMRRLQTLSKCGVTSTEKLGVHPDQVEAMAFAWLAYRYTHKLTGNLPTVTGANTAVMLGELTCKPV